MAASFVSVERVGDDLAAGDHGSNPITLRRRRERTRQSRGPAGGNERAGRRALPPGCYFTVTFPGAFAQLLSSLTSSMMSRESAQVCTIYSPTSDEVTTVTVLVDVVFSVLRRAAIAWVPFR